MPLTLILQGLLFHGRGRTFQLLCLWAEYVTHSLHHVLINDTWNWYLRPFIRYENLLVDSTYLNNHSLHGKLHRRLNAGLILNRWFVNLAIKSCWSVQGNLRYQRPVMRIQRMCDLTRDGRSARLKMVEEQHLCWNMISHIFGRLVCQALWSSWISGNVVYTSNYILQCQAIQYPLSYSSSVHY